MFYANLLVRVGGYIVVDDCTWSSVSAAVSYFRNYPAFEQLNEPAITADSMKHRIAKAIATTLRPGVARAALPAGLYDRYYRRVRFPRMVTFKKVAEDTRDWKWYGGV